MHITGIDNSHDCINCRQNQILSMLELENFPAALLLYNLYINTRYAFDNIFVKKQARWLVNNEFVLEQDLENFGVTLTNVHWRDIQEVEPIIRGMIDEGRYPFVPANCFYIPHHPIYNKTHFPHSLVMTRYEVHEGGTKLFVADDVSHEFKIYEYDYKELEMAIQTYSYKEQGDSFTRLPDERTISTYAYNQVSAEKLQALRDEIEVRHSKFVANLQEDYFLYDHVKELINGDYVEFASQNELIDLLIHTFSALKGSRQLFGRYLSYTGGNEELIERLRACEKRLETIRILLLKSQMTGRLNAEVIFSKCSSVKEMEMEFVKLLKENNEVVTSR
ncbi:hypothetical protein FHS18_006167 [Paenibacillus phyllosphaerae]|uniref:Butirosin biosynthesis protein H N-terminal domain-containing protein n=1 Tax=Paenibacillus phyllosphaerae TaxID=274593 RepID=A0A7W5B5K6_9BACL|nr:hypothetical protein [Paenibacillus phyllosphaerae]MBB3114051.1 hypothetical protein [Paenibacillus phyllosphaerae]